jgi:preprotein translocase subunit SecE
MSTAISDNGKKWIQASVAILCMITGYVLMSFFETLGDWFELEAKISSFNAIIQILSVDIAAVVFFYIMKNKKTSTHLSEVYQEAVKVVWPDKSATVRHTIGIMIGVTIVGFILGVFDIVSAWALSLIN